MANVIGNAWNSLFDKDQHMWDKFDENQKLGFSRLIREVVKADGVVHGIEISELPDIHKSYLNKSASISVEDAVKHLQGISTAHKDLIRKELSQISNTDGHLAEEEKRSITRITEMLSKA